MSKYNLGPIVEDMAASGVEVAFVDDGGDVVVLVGRGLGADVVRALWGEDGKIVQMRPRKS